MKFDFIATNDHLTINAEGVEETSTAFEVAMGTVFKGDKGDKGDLGQGYSNKGDWEAGTTYEPFDVVKYLNSVYVCLVENTSSAPPLNNTDWVVWIDSSIMVNKDDNQNITGIKTFDNGLKVGTDAQIGTFTLNTNDNTIDLSLKDGVSLQIGQEFLVPVRNGESNQLNDGELVHTTSTIGNSGRLVVQRFPTNNGNALTTVGVVTQNIVSGGYGYVTILGKVRGIDTSMWNDGDLLYPDPATAGALTNVLPIAPKTKTIVGRVVKAHTNGTIFVRPINAMNLLNASDVLAYNPATLTENSILLWDATNKCWVAKTSISELTTTSKTIVGAINEVNAGKIDKTAIVDKLGTDPNKLMSQKATTDAIMKSYNYDVNQLAYGVRLDLTGVGKPLERVGNLSLHKTRPISRKAKNCVKNVAGVNYYLSDDTDLLKADGVTPSVLDGTDGDVMKEIPEFFGREYTEENYAYTYISEFPLPGFIRIPKTYHGLYEGSYDTTTNQTRSVINATIRTGLPATGQSRSYYNNGARLNRNITWNIDTLLSNYVRELLFRVDYATYDSQAPYNSQPNAEGYLQGGLGAGVTALDNHWAWNDYNPFIPCGYTAELGNKTGVKDFTMPYGYDGYDTVAPAQKYIGVYNPATIYNIGEYVSDKEDTTIGQGDGKLYKCIQQTTAGILLTNTAYFTEQVRTKVQVNRFLVEMPFGHTFKHTIDSIIEITNAYTTTKCYIYDNPEHYPTSNANDIKTANARFLCDMPSAEGYVKTFNKYTLVPYAIGGSSNSWGYDSYSWRGEAGGVLRSVQFGGTSDYGANAGFGCSIAYFSTSNNLSYYGVRLCNFPEGSNIVINS